MKYSAPNTFEINQSAKKNNEIIETEVCIVGAGPGGISAAMNLNKLGIHCVLVDKSEFPRDKVCGESFDGHVFYCLKRINPNYFDEMIEQKIAIKSWHYQFIDENGAELHLKYDKTATPRILTRRIDFDNFLITKIKEMSYVTLLENTNIDKIEHLSDGVLLSSKNKIIKAKIIIGATGATSRFFNIITKKEKRDGDIYTSMRLYFKNSTISNDYKIKTHIFYNPMIMLYTCPLPNGIISVQIGIKQKDAKKYNINLKNKLFEILNTYEPVKNDFVNAELVSKVKGASMSLSYKKAKYYGDRFLLVGALAQSVHPATGFGVGHAMEGGEIAAHFALKAIEKNDFSVNFLKVYEKALYKKLGSEVFASRLLVGSFKYIQRWIPYFFKLINFLQKKNNQTRTKKI